MHQCSGMYQVFVPRVQLSTMVVEPFTTGTRTVRGSTKYYRRGDHKKYSCNASDIHLLFTNMNTGASAALPTLSECPRKLTARTPQTAQSMPSPRRATKQQLPQFPDVLTPRHNVGASAAQIAEHLSLEHEARQRYVAAQKRRAESVHKTVTQTVLTDNRRNAEELRDQMDRISCRDVVRRLSNVRPADEADQTILSEQFNKKLAALYPEVKGHMWFKLFQAMDADGSGRICFVEFRRAIRKVLHEDVATERVRACPL